MNPRPFSRRQGLIAAAASLLAVPAMAVEPNFPITSQQRSTAQQVAQAGVPLSELAPNAPDSHTVQSGDTLWDISKLFLKSPWRWPELWGMNLEQIRNPHLIYPGQVLVLEKTGDRARLRLAQSGSGAPDNTVKLSPRIRSNLLDNGAIGSIPLHLIGPFLTEAVIFNNDELARAPRIVAAQEGYVAMSQGQLAYVLGDLGRASGYRLFREPQPLYDFDTKELLGYEARYVGTAEFVRPGSTRHRSRRQAGDRCRPRWPSSRCAWKSMSATGWRRCRRATWTLTYRTIRTSRWPAACCKSTAMRSAQARTRSWR